MENSEATTVYAAPGVLEKLISKAITEALLERNFTSPSLLRSGGGPLNDLSSPKFTAAQLSQMVDQEEYSNPEALCLNDVPLFSNALYVSLVPTPSHEAQPTVTAEELKQCSPAKQSVNSFSLFALAILFGSISCLITVDRYSIRLSNIKACDLSAVINNSLPGDYHFPASEYNSNTITSINKETTYGAIQCANERDNNVSITHAVVLPTLNTPGIAGVLIFDPGGSHPCS
jgi:hypothetical protein